MRYFSIILILIVMLLITTETSHSQVKITLPKIEIGDKSASGGANLSTGIQVLLLLTALSLAPAFLLMMTSFTRIIVVLSLLRSALSIPQTPPNQVMIGMALFLTLFVMAPTWKTVNTEAITPYMAGKITYKDAIDKGSKPIRQFMFRQTKEKDLGLMVQMARMSQPKNENDIPTHVLIPAFIISELNTAFKIGFMLFIPFIVIDMVISSVLMAMGMMMLPPAMISLPFKILLFVLADGWTLIVKSLVAGFS
ncbi:MAG: Flagellar biosynthetic protein FliP [Candidatus Poribacteria bacterium]|nr:Flagellar biosynthetic protein FliP [Candidatus Poribacteria bacterium]